jgi:hypothetical protein
MAVLSGAVTGSTLAKTSPNLAVVNAPAADPTVRDSSLDFTRPVAALTAAPVPSTAAAPAMAPLPPTAPVQPPAAGLLHPIDDRQPASRSDHQRLVSDTVGNTAAAASTAVDPGFISSTRNVGLFSITSAADPADDNFLTSGADPEDNLLRLFDSASSDVSNGNEVTTRRAANGSSTRR